MPPGGEAAQVSSRWTRRTMAGAARTTRQTSNGARNRTSAKKSALVSVTTTAGTKRNH